MNRRELMSCTLSTDLLDEYLDEELEPARAREVERHLAGCPACAARLRAERAIRERIRVLAADETAPELLRRGIEAQVREPAAGATAPRQEEAAQPTWSLRRPALRFGFALAASIVALLLVWTLVPRGGVSSALAAGLAEDHLEHHGPMGREYMVHERDQAALERWFEDRLGTMISLPDEAPMGELVGGQICIVNGRRVAHAMYQVNGEIVSYYVVPGVPGPPEPVTGGVEEVQFAAWSSPPGGVFVLGRGPADELSRFRLE